MNWSRAKTILITAFLIINIILAAFLIEENAVTEDSTTNIITYEDVVLFLQKQGVTIHDEEEPSYRSTVREVTFSPYPLDSDETATALWGDLFGVTKSIVEGDTPITTYTKDDAFLTINSTGALFFGGGVAGEAKVLEEEAVKIATEKIEEIIPEADMTLTAVVENETGFFITYIQNADEMPIAGTYVNVTVENGAIISYAQYVVMPEVGLLARQEVIPPEDALLSLTGYLGEGQSIHIVSVTQGFYSQSFNADHWTAVPVWIIETEGNFTYNINAITGAIEMGN